MHSVVWLLTPSKVEAAALQKGLRKEEKNSLSLRITGVGAVATLHTLWGWHHREEKPIALIAVGLAGSYSKHLMPPMLVSVVQETWGDLGKRRGRFFFPTHPTLREDFALSLKGACECPLAVPSVRGVTLNTVSGSYKEARFWRRNYPDADIETQENAAYFLFANTHQIPFLSFRVISNKVGDKKWALEEALQALTEFSEKYVASLCEWLLARNTSSHEG
ncbi:MAG: hypothetical protein RMJ66_00320 [Bacteroidia bacterium]|nr:hypothetical protein [Bacteroidia bacterium]MDW8133488.1 hypothetical protein [Bacteroidia bacterium]